MTNRTPLHDPHPPTRNPTRPALHLQAHEIKRLHSRNLMSVPCSSSKKDIIKDALTSWSISCGMRRSQNSWFASERRARGGRKSGGGGGAYRLQRGGRARRCSNTWTCQRTQYEEVQSPRGRGRRVHRTRASRRESSGCKPRPYRGLDATRTPLRYRFQHP